MYLVWQKDFESDNFKIEDIVDKVNRVLIQRAYYPIEAKKVTSAIRTNNVNITKAISDLIWEKNQVELDLVISKRQLAETLI